MQTRTLLIIGLLGSSLAVLLGLMTFPDQRREFYLNLTSEAVGILVGGLIVVAVLDAYQNFIRRKHWARVEDELFSRIYWEIERLHFSVRPLASWHVGNTLSEDLQALVAARSGPISAASFIDLASRIQEPLAALTANVTPRIIALGEDEQLIAYLLDLEEAGLEAWINSQYLTEKSPASEEYAGLIDEVLRKSAVVVDFLDGLRFGRDAQRAAQLRFERLRAARFASSWSSDSRTVYLPDGKPYQPGF